MESSISEFESNFLLDINFIHEVKIFNEIQNNKKILIFDLRKREDYLNSNLKFSINLPYDEHSHEIYKNFDEEILCTFTQDSEVKEMLRKFRRFYIVIIMSEVKIPRKRILKYTECIDDEKCIVSKSMLLYEALTRRKVRDLGLFNLGFRIFREHYEFIVNRGGLTPLAK